MTTQQPVCRRERGLLHLLALDRWRVIEIVEVLKCVIEGLSGVPSTEDRRGTDHTLLDAS